MLRRSALRANPSTVRRKVIAAVLVAGAFGLPTTHAQSQSTQEIIRFVVPFPPGGTVDHLARLYAHQISSRGQNVSVIVDNRPGANGVLAVQAVLQAPANGRTYLFTTPSSVASNVALLKTLPYDPLTDLVPVARLARTHAVLVTSASSKFVEFKDLVEASKKKQPMTFAAGAPGYTVMFEQIRQASGADAVVVGYKGTAAALLDVASGTVDLSLADPTAVYPLVKGGKLRALAVMKDSADPQLPGVPTSSQVGAGPASIFQWMGVFAKAGTPSAEIGKARSLLRSAFEDPQLTAGAGANSVEPFWGDASALGQQQALEVQLFKDLMRTAGMQQQ